METLKQLEKMTVHFDELIVRMKLINIIGMRVDELKETLEPLSGMTTRVDELIKNRPIK